MADVLKRCIELIRSAPECEDAGDFVLEAIELSKRFGEVNSHEFHDKAARAYKLALLRSRQKHLGTDIMDEVAVKLNAQPTYQEEQLVKLMWGIFEELGARIDG